MALCDAALAATHGLFDHSRAYGLLQWLQRGVEAIEPEVEYHPGDGLFVEPHLCDRKAELKSMLDQARQHLEQFDLLCQQVLEAL